MPVLCCAVQGIASQHTQKGREQDAVPEHNRAHQSITKHDRAQQRTTENNREPDRTRQDTDPEAPLLVAPTQWAYCGHTVGILWAYPPLPRVPLACLVSPSPSWGLQPSPDARCTRGPAPTEKGAPSPLGWPYVWGGIGYAMCQRGVHPALLGGRHGMSCAVIAWQHRARGNAAAA